MSGIILSPKPSDRIVAGDDDPAPQFRTRNRENKAHVALMAVGSSELLDSEPRLPVGDGVLPRPRGRAVKAWRVFSAHRGKKFASLPPLGTRARRKPRCNNQLRSFRLGRRFLCCLPGSVFTAISRHFPATHSFRVILTPIHGMLMCQSAISRSTAPRSPHRESGGFTSRRADCPRAPAAVPR